MPYYHRRNANGVEESTWTADSTWPSGGGSGSLPAGLIVLSLSSCPPGFSEVTALSGKFALGTVAANADVGGTGGADNVTPAGTVSQPTFTGNAFSSVINHTHTINVTDPGHNHTQNSHTHPSIQVQGNTTAATTGTHIMTSTTTGGSSRAATSPELANAATATNIANTTGITATSSNPSGGVASITPTGTVSQPTFTGTQFDNRPAFTRVIFCQKD